MIEPLLERTYLLHFEGYYVISSNLSASESDVLIGCTLHAVFFFWLKFVFIRILIVIWAFSYLYSIVMIRIR